MNTIVPFILLDTKITYSEAGRLFAEINAQSNPLGELHQLFLRHILMLPSHKPYHDFGDPSINQKREITRKANRFGFEIGAILNSEKDSPLYNKIRFWDKDNDSGNYNAISSAEWTKLAANWYHGKFRSLDELARIHEVREYFKAWEHISNLNLKTNQEYSNKQSNNRWGKFKRQKTGVKSYVWRTAVFKSIMMLFSRAFHLKTDTNKPYTEILRPCAHIDFTHPSWEDSIFSGKRVEEITNHLFYWMESAIDDFSVNQEIYDNEFVWNHDDESEDILSAPGRGFFSQPNPDYLTVAIHWKNANAKAHLWENRSIEIQSHGVPNNSKALETTVEYFDPNEKNKSNSWKTEKNTNNRTTKSENPTLCTFSHKFSTAADSKHALRIRVRVTGGNLFSDKTPLFEQEFTLDQVNNLNDKIIIFRNKDDDDEGESSASPSNDNDNDDGGDNDDFFSSLEIKSAKKVESKNETYRTPKTLVASERPVEKGGLCILGFHGIDHTCKICWKK